MNYSIILKLQDLMSPKLQKVVDVARNAQDKIGHLNDKISSGFKKSSTTVGDLQNKLKDMQQYRTQLRVGVDNNEIRRSNVAINALKGEIDGLTGRGSNLLRFGGIIRRVAGAFTVYKAASMGFSLFQKSIDLGDIEDVFRRAGHNDLLNNLKDFQKANLAYSRKDILQNAERIYGVFGSENTMAITDLVSKLAQGNSGNLDKITDRIERMLRRTSVKARDIKDFASLGLSDLPEQMAKIRGISIDKFNQMVHENKIGTREMLNDLMKLSQAGEVYSNAYQDGISGIRQKWAQIRNYVSESAMDMVSKASSGVSKALDKVMQFLKESAPIGKAFDQLGSAFKGVLNGIFKVIQNLGLFGEKGNEISTIVTRISRVIDWLRIGLNLVGKTLNWVGDMFERYPWMGYVGGFLAMNYVIGRSSAGILDFALNFSKLAASVLGFPFGLLRSGFSTIATGLSTIGKLLTLLWANPVGLIVAGVIALGAAIYIAWQRSETFRRVVIQTWEALKTVWSAAVSRFRTVYNDVSLLMNQLAGVWNRVMARIVERLQPVLNFIAKGFGRLKEVFGNVTDWIHDKFSGLWPKLIAGAKVASLGIANAFTFGLAGKVLKKFGIGFEEGKSVAAEFEKARKAQDVLDKKKDSKSQGFFSKFSESFGGFGSGTKDLGLELGKTSGITDTVKGATSKEVTINLNSKITDIYNTFNGAESPEELGKKITDLVLMELNRILLTGDRLAIE